MFVDAECESVSNVLWKLEVPSCCWSWMFGECLKACLRLKSGRYRLARGSVAWEGVA